MPRIILADNLDVLPTMPDASVNLIYVDPPFNTGKMQQRTRIKTVRDENGDRVGFQDRRYRTVRVGTSAFADQFDDFLSFIEPRLLEAHRVLLCWTEAAMDRREGRENHYSAGLDG